MMMRKTKLCEEGEERSVDMQGKEMRRGVKAGQGG